ncbi:MAG: methionine synthase [bacterium]
MPLVDLEAPVPARRAGGEIRDFLAERVLLLDGATGTGFQARDLSAEDFGGPALEGCNESLVFTRPDVVADLHASYFDAGADMVETNTFGGTPIVLAEYGLAEKAREINRRAGEIAKRVAAAWTSPGRPRFVAGSIGPTTKAISVTGGITFEALTAAFREQAIGLVEGNVDVLLVETQQDTRNAKAALIAIEEAFAQTAARVPVMLSCTIEPTGTMLAGQSVEAFWASVSHFPLLSVGLNCATGPEFMTDHLRSLAAIATCFTSCVPNAGLPNPDGTYSETPARMAEALGRFLESGWVNVIGGCCGTTPAHIRAFRDVASAARPRRPPTARRTIVSGIEFLEATEDVRPVLVGERTNVIGSRKFKTLIDADKFEEGAEIARRQVKGGAQVVDVNLQNPDRDEIADVRRFYERLVRMVKVPLMIDTTSAEAIGLALTYCQGKSIVNSINLEDGEERFDRVLPFVKRFGAAVVVGTIDEDPVQGMGVTRERKLEIARRSFRILTEKWQIPPEDILWDALVFPVGAGDVQYAGSAIETLAAIPLLKKEFPGTKTILGISNVSFGLPSAGRDVLNSVYLYQATKAGLDFAIVNTEKLERYNLIPPEERELCENLLFRRGDDPVAAFAAHFRAARTRTVGAHGQGPALPLDERISRYIVEGTKDGLVADLDRKLAEGAKPLDVINGPLMRGMAEVGRLFNDNQLIVAEVLQSAEAMKAAVSHLEQFMEKADSRTKGKVILATVKGDVHDIGKNLVEIVLSNNGYDVVNLGIKIPPETLIEKCHELQPDILGLSGLLVKSAQMMVVTAEDLSRAGVTPTMLVGGAALSDTFTRTKIVPAYAGNVFYAKDAMAGLALSDRIRGADGGLDALVAETRERDLKVAAERPTKQDYDPGAKRSSNILPVDLAPRPPDLERHVVMRADLREIWPWINPQALFGRHLGLRRNFEKLLAEGDSRAKELDALVKGIEAEGEAGRMRASAVWRWVRAEAEGNVVRLLDESGRALEEFVFRRQRKPDGVCLADWVREKGTGEDWVALFVVTMGDGVRAWAEDLKQRGEYLKSHAVQALALEGAEAYAELLHARLRAAWGFPDPPETSMMDRFRARYHGKRVSFGYPACPDLEDQAKLWRLLRPEEIGVELTDGFMMDPEASVSALVFHHPQAEYFGVGRDE